MSHSDTVFLNWSVTFRHGIFESECHVPTRYSWIGVSRSDMIILKEKYVQLMEEILNLKELNSQNGLVWRHESSCLILISLTYYELTLMLLILVHVVYCLSPVKCYS